MPVRFLPDAKGQEAVLRQLADGLDAFALDVRDKARAHAPFGTGEHPPRGKKRPPLQVHYRDTIGATTFLNGEVYAGHDVRTPQYNRRRWAICSVVYTTFAPFGHIYEVTGAGPHKIPGTIGAGGHPGVSKRPHFVPGLFEAAAEAGVTMGGRILAKRGHS